MERKFVPNRLLDIHSLKSNDRMGLKFNDRFGIKALTNYSKNYTLLFHDGKLCQKYAILRRVS